MIDALLSAFITIVSGPSILFLIAGVIIGLIVGVIPGFGGTVGLSLLLPFVFGMEPISGIAMMMGLLSVVATSDTFPAVLIGVPGSVSAQATVMDGFPLAKKVKLRELYQQHFFFFIWWFVWSNFTNNDYTNCKTNYFSFWNRGNVDVGSIWNYNSWNINWCQYI